MAQLLSLPLGVFAFLTTASVPKPVFLSSALVSCMPRFPLCPQPASLKEPYDSESLPMSISFPCGNDLRFVGLTDAKPLLDQRHSQRVRMMLTSSISVKRQQVPLTWDTTFFTHESHLSWPQP